MLGPEASEAAAIKQGPLARGTKPPQRAPHCGERGLLVHWLSPLPSLALPLIFFPTCRRLNSAALAAAVAARA